MHEYTQYTLLRVTLPVVTEKGHLRPPVWEQEACGFGELGETLVTEQHLNIFVCLQFPLQM